MSKLFKCSICGREYDNVNDFLKCVTNCAADVKRKEKEESEQRLAEINAAINGVKQAKAYYDQKLKEFKEKYPKEYELNFRNDSGCFCNCCDDIAKTVPKSKKDTNNSSMKTTYDFQDTVNEMLNLLKLQ